MTNMSAPMLIRIAGPPLTKFDPTKYMGWLAEGRGHHSLVNADSKVRRFCPHPNDEDF
jgi:hypothetical protein